MKKSSKPFDLQLRFGCCGVGVSVTIYYYTYYVG